MLAASHEALVDDFRGIVSAGVDVNAFAHDRVGARAECFARFVAAGLDLGFGGGGGSGRGG